MNFNNFTKEIIGPTLTFYGFILKNVIDGVLEFEQEKLIIFISYDYKVSFEVDVTFTFKKNSQSYNYSEIKEYFYNSKINFATQITNNTNLILWLEELQNFLKEHLNNLLMNDIMVCYELEKKRKKNIYNYELNRSNRFLIENVEKYWIEKDYVGLITFIEKYNMNFEENIRRKYEYSKKMIAKNKLF